MIGTRVMTRLQEREKVVIGQKKQQQQRYYGMSGVLDCSSKHIFGRRGSEAHRLSLRGSYDVRPIRYRKIIYSLRSIDLDDFLEETQLCQMRTMY
jgi:hypothetical protein